MIRKIPAVIDFLLSPKEELEIEQPGEDSGTNEMS